MSQLVFEHLHPELRSVMTLSQAERIKECRQDRWVAYTRATQTLGRLNDLLYRPPSIRVTNILLVGRANNGKSSILRAFSDGNQAFIEEDGTPNLGLLVIEMPEHPNESALWAAILWQLGIAHRAGEKKAVLKSEAIAALRHCKIRVLAIDEFHNIAGVGKDTVHLLNALKGLMNQLKLSIVASGTQAAINALNYEPQMKSRFEPAPLNRWVLDREYLSFLNTYEKMLPLAEPSNLASREVATKLYGMAGEAIGSTVKLLQDAAVAAIQSGHERIDVSILEQLPRTTPNDWDNVPMHL